MFLISLELLITLLMCHSKLSSRKDLGFKTCKPRLHLIPEFCFLPPKHSQWYKETCNRLDTLNQPQLSAILEDSGSSVDAIYQKSEFSWVASIADYNSHPAEPRRFTTRDSQMLLSNSKTGPLQSVNPTCNQCSELCCLRRRDRLRRN